MKMLLIISISIILAALFVSLVSKVQEPVLHHHSTPAEASMHAIMKHENYTVWDKKFDRYASYWLQTLGHEKEKNLCASLTHKTIQDTL